MILLKYEIVFVWIKRIFVYNIKGFNLVLMEIGDFCIDKLNWFIFWIFILLLFYKIKKKGKLLFSLKLVMYEIVYV